MKDELLDPANAKRFARELELCVAKRPGEELAREKARLESLEAKLTAAFARWEALEG